MLPVPNLRHVLRGTLARPLFGLTVAVVIGLGIGATTTVYSVIDGVLLSELPYPEARRLVAVGTTFPSRNPELLREDEAVYRLAGVAMGNFRDWRDRATTLDRLVAAEHRALDLQTPDGPERVTIAAVTEGFFETFGAGPQLGRMFVDADAAPGAAAVALLSDEVWRSRFGADPGIVGTTIETTGEPVRVVGVLEPGFSGPEAMSLSQVGFWMPLNEQEQSYEDRGRRSLYVLGRLAPDATLANAREELWALADRIAREVPEGNVYPDGSQFGAGANPLRGETIGDVSATLWAFLGAVLLLLLVACVNVANLFLARGLDRERELSVRAALGAGRARIVGQLMSESLILALAGGAIGAGLAILGVRTFVAWAPPSLPRLAEVAVDLRVLVFTLLSSVVTALLFGLAPALHLSRTVPAEALRGAGRVAGSRGGARPRGLLVAAESALALVLAIGAALLLNSVVRLQAVDPGFRTEGISTFVVNAPGGWEDSGATHDFRRRLLERLRAEPGVDAVAVASNVPAQDPNWAAGILFGGESEGEGRGIPTFMVSEGYFELLGITRVAGRIPSDDLAADAPGEVVVNRAFVREFVPDSDPLELEFRMSWLGGYRPVRVVGVVENIRQNHPSLPPEPAVYAPAAQIPWPVQQVLVRSATGGSFPARAAREAVAEVDPTVPITRFATLSERLWNTTIEPRFYALLMTGFAAVAILLAAAGIYATAAYGVSQRTHEMGIRMALGATVGAVRGLVVRQALATVVLGMATGIAAAALATRALGDMLFEVAPRDIATFAAAAMAFLLVALVSLWLPARRATRMDVLSALREE